MKLRNYSLWVVLFFLVTVPAIAADRPVSFGVEFGYAHQQEMLGSGHPPSGVQLAIAHVQVINTLFTLPNKPRRSLQLVNELDFMQSIKPGSRFIIGESQAVRLNFPLSSNWTMFTDVGMGISSSAMRIPENTGWFQYLLQGGAGFKHCRPGEKVCSLAQYRLVHMSNNATAPPNLGLNMHAVFVGVNF